MQMKYKFLLVIIAIMTISNSDIIAQIKVFRVERLTSGPAVNFADFPNFSAIYIKSQVQGLEINSEVSLISKIALSNTETLLIVPPNKQRVFFEAEGFVGESLEVTSMKPREVVWVQLNALNSPRFSDYPSGPVFIPSRRVDINPNSGSGPLGQLFYAIDRRGREPDGRISFASFYEFVLFGVGTGCWQGVSIDLRDGKVYGLPINCPACIVGEYVDFRVDSQLLVNTICDGTGIDWQATYYYKWNEKRKTFEEVEAN